MSNFKPNNLVKECINNKDIKGLKGALVGIILSDRNFSKGYFDNTVSYIIDNCGSDMIYEKFDGEDILSVNIKNSKITEDDFAEAVYNLKDNFCQERINDVKAISKEIYGNKAIGANKKEVIFTEDKDGNNPIKKQISHQREVNQKEENNSIKVVVGIAVVAAIAVAIAMKAMK
ncbi:hypothetical protein [Clostridium vincentii]|uniref:Uncharacterized protein n=1 Tax=Clostridium vincentii TaxID=52704 RepID=A0A2T0BDL5_9CLOT|nr:hypothetical protein [Clostridium vincentii]PRR82000.1 hypothetical protein CLVI_20650 [Clostridium vincentii]